jgi:glycosyltransferase involved in cell wall biosynthesis
MVDSRDRKKKLSKLTKQKNILIITYYWPPSGGAGVQRWLKMSGYLADSFHVHVYAPENPFYSIVDESLEEDVDPRISIVKRRIWEPYKLANLVSKKNKVYQKGNLESQDKRSIMAQLSVFVRANFFIPDARIAWVRPSLRFLTSYIRNHNIETIITTGPPHSMHLIGLHLKRNIANLQWLADFRDPWTEIDYFENLNLTKQSLRKHRRLELTVLQEADEVIAVAPSLSERLEEMSSRPIRTILNGFDAKDFEVSNEKSEALTMVYTGAINQDRNQPFLWECLERMCVTHKAFRDHFRLKIIGTIDGSVTQQITALPHLSERTELLGYMNHKDAIQEMFKAQVLLLLINKTANKKGILTGKLFEYLATGRRILCIGPKEGDVDRILTDSKAGHVVDYDDKAGLIQTLENYLDEYKIDALNGASIRDIHQYSRQSTAQEFAQLINSSIQRIKQ